MLFITGSNLNKTIKLNSIYIYLNRNTHLFKAALQKVHESFYNLECSVIRTNTQSSYTLITIMKFADDTAILSLLYKKMDSSTYQNKIDTFVKWCDTNCRNSAKGLTMQERRAP